MAEVNTTVLLTVAEYAEAAKVSKWTVWRLVRSGALEARHIGRSVRLEAP